MNERIKLLSDQALDEVIPYTWTTLSYEEIQKLQNRFAELLIREYIGILETEIELVKGYKSTACNAFDERWHNGKIEHFTKLVGKCEKHFGVE